MANSRGVCKRYERKHERRKELTIYAVNILISFFFFFLRSNFSLSLSLSLTRCSLLSRSIGEIFKQRPATGLKPTGRYDEQISGMAPNLYKNQHFFFFFFAIERVENDLCLGKRKIK
jgi:hypothetical protein